MDGRRETGIGSWTDDEIARAIREGVSRDGTALFPIMPYESFRHMSDEDLTSVVVYLRSIPPVRNALARTALEFPMTRIVNTMPVPLEESVPEPAAASREPTSRRRARSAATRTAAAISMSKRTSV